MNKKKLFTESYLLDLEMFAFTMYSNVILIFAQLERSNLYFLIYSND